MQRYYKTLILGIFFFTAFIFISFFCAPKLNPDKWIFLGMSQFDERHDTASIRVGPSEGVFSRLRFEVSGAVELNWVIVFFSNGDRWSPNEGFSASFKARHGLGHGDQEFDLLTDFITNAGTVKVYGLKEIN
jgi:hypothetical protein